MTSRWIAGLWTACLLIGCGDDGEASGDGESSGSSSGAIATTGDSPSGIDDDGGVTTDDDETASTGASDESSDEGSEGSDTTGPTGPVPELPSADGPCPEFVAGDLEFQPAETGPRRARVYFDPAAGGGGPVVFWFHGTGGSPEGSANAISAEDRDAIVAMGGMVVMPWNDPASGQFPWFLVDEQREDDLHMMDEIVACAAAGPGIDARHIHAAGFSAGGLHTSQAGLRRASYIASTVVFSGGIYSETVPSDAPEQVVSSMVFHGGPGDNVGGFDFVEPSELFAGAVRARGGYALLCNHGQGHALISEREFSWEFMQAHPFDAAPSPFEGGMPSWVPSYCQP